MASRTNQNVADPYRATLDMISSGFAGLWTALPCIVDSYDPVAVTIVAQPCIQGQQQMPDGSLRMIDMPLLPDVPVCFARGGGLSITHPIQAGDECLVIFASRCIDAWWQSGGVQPPMENRKHDLSDGFAIFAPQSQPNRLSNVATDAVQIRTDDGEALIELTRSMRVNIKSSRVKLDAPSVSTTKNLSVGTGATGVFTSATGQIITVTNGIITKIM